MVVPTFSGVVDADGKLHLESRREFVAYLRGLAHQRVQVVVRKPQSQRSLDQNAYWHGVLFPMIAKFTGDDIEDVKWWLMGECYGWRRCAIAGRDVPVRPHTASLTTAEGAEFTDWAIAWAAKHCDGLQIPFPNEAAA